MSTPKYVFAKEFSRNPGGRQKAHGKFSGEEFFETVLLPAHEKSTALVLDLTGVRGFATSFLDGAFGEFASRFGRERFHKLFTLEVRDDTELAGDIEEAMERGAIQGGKEPG